MRRPAGSSPRCGATCATQFILVASTAWVALEWLRGWFLSGFPWMTLGYSQIDSWLAGFAPVIGIFGVSLMLMLSASALLLVFEKTGNTRPLSRQLPFSPGWPAPD